jgi:hypothetical protein
MHLTLDVVLSNVCNLVEQMVEICDMIDVLIACFNVFFNIILCMEFCNSSDVISHCRFPSYKSGMCVCVFSVCVTSRNIYLTL